MKRLAGVLVALSVVALACGGGASSSSSVTGCSAGSAACPPPPPPPPPPPQVDPPIVNGDFAFYSTAQGLSADVWDASADEAGNVYVATGDALYVKRRADVEFKKFDPAAASITKNCDAAGTKPCPLVSVAGGPPGVAYVGLRGIGTDGDSDPNWQLDSGGIDVLAFDGSTVAKTRHVEVAGVPHTMCQDHTNPAITGKPCSADDNTWNLGRRKVRQVLRMAVNHDKSRIQYGDVWIAGTHGTFSLLVANPDKRGWVDRTKDFPGTQDRQFVWEHDHPAITANATINGVLQDSAFLTGESTAITIDPTTGDPWASNECRTATKRGYGAGASNWDVDMWPGQTGPTSADRHMDIWPDPTTTPGYDAMDPRWLDAVSSLSFCDDGTLWIASSLHGIVRRDASGTLTYIDLPPGTGNNASAIACDPSNGSAWVGFGWGGFGRYDGSWWIVPVQPGAPFASNGPVRSIQIDRWASPRIVYFAHSASSKAPGGLTVYTGR